MFRIHLFIVVWLHDVTSHTLHPVAPSEGGVQLTSRETSQQVAMVAVVCKKGLFLVGRRRLGDHQSLHSSRILRWKPVKVEISFNNSFGMFRLWLMRQWVEIVCNHFSSSRNGGLFSGKDISGDVRNEDRRYLRSGSISVHRKAIRQNASGHEPQYFSRNIILLSPKSGLRGM